MRHGWEIKKLGEICDFSNGLWTGKRPPFINVGVIRNTNFTKEGALDDTDIVFLNVEQSQFAKRRLKFGDIILEKSGGGPKQPVGRVIVFNKKEGNYSFSNFTSVIRINSPKQADFTYLHRFLFFSYISGVTETMQSHSTGIRNLKFDDYKDIEVPLPPLTEQQHIVAILDEAFAALSKAKDNAKQNLKNAKELFESYLESKFSNRDKRWKEKSLGEICEIKPPKSEARSKLQKTDFVSFVPMEDLGINQKLFTPTKERPLSQVEGSYTYFANDDVLLAKITPCFENGKLGIARNLRNGIGFGSSEFLVFRVPENMYSEFLYYYLLRQKFHKEGAERMMGAVGHKRVSKEFIDNYSIPLPSLNEQKAIVQKLDNLSVEASKLEAIYQKKIEDLEELKKSLLQKAFNGELKTS